MVLISPDEIEYSAKHNIFRFKSPNCKLDKGVELSNINYGWLMWQEGKASAVPKGYVLCKSKPVAYIVQNKFWKQEFDIKSIKDMPPKKWEDDHYDVEIPLYAVSLKSLVK